MKLSPRVQRLWSVFLSIKALIALLAGGYTLVAGISLLITAYDESKPTRLQAAELPKAFSGQRWITLVGRPAVEMSVNHMTFNNGEERFALYVPIVSLNHAAGDPVYAVVYYPTQDKRYSKQFIADLEKGPHEFTGTRAGWTTDKPHRDILAPDLCGEPFLSIAIDAKPPGPVAGWCISGLGFLFLIAGALSLIARWRRQEITAFDAATGAI